MYMTIWGLAAHYFPSILASIFPYINDVHFSYTREIAEAHVGKAMDALSIDQSGNQNEITPILSDSETRKSQPTNKWSTAKAVYFAAIACFGGLGFGLTIVFSSPLLDDLTNSNLTQWKEGFSTDKCAYQVLIGPISPIAAVAGGLLSAPLTAVTGLVTGMILTAVVYVSGWTMLGCSYFITSPYAFRGLLLTGRALTGFAMGFSAASVPVSAVHAPCYHCCVVGSRSKDT